MSGHVSQVLLAIPHLLSILLHCIFVLGVGGQGKDDKKFAPEDTLLHVLESMVKVHRVEWFCSIEVGLVGVHVMLEFNSIFRSHKFSVLMIFLKEVMD